MGAARPAAAECHANHSRHSREALRHAGQLLLGDHRSMISRTATGFSKQSQVSLTTLFLCGSPENGSWIET